MTDTDETGRRTVLRRLSLLATVGLAGCSSGGESTPSDSDESGTPTPDGDETTTPAETEAPSSPTPEGDTPDEQSADSVFEPPDDGGETTSGEETPTATPTSNEADEPPGPPGT